MQTARTATAPCRKRVRLCCLICFVLAYPALRLLLFSGVFVSELPPAAARLPTSRLPLWRSVQRRCSYGVEAVQARYRGLIEAPACAILGSSRVCEAAKVLAKLAEENQLKAFVSAALSLFQSGRLMSGRDRLNWQDLLSDNALLLTAADREALGKLARLLTVGTNDAIPLSVQQGSVMPGVVPGALGQRKVEVRIRDAGLCWGPTARMVVSEGPNELIGLHLVAWKRFGPGGTRVYRGRAELACEPGAYTLCLGDTLYLAPPDRAAFLEIATFDRQPMSAMLLREHDFTGVETDLEVTLVDMGEELRDARSFAESQQDLSDADRAAAQLRRLASFPIVCQVVFAAKQDKYWSQILPVLAPLALKAYKAAELQLPSFWSKPQASQLALRGNEVIALVLAASLVLAAFAALNLGLF